MSRFLHDISTLAAWMGEAREMIDSWNQPSGSEESSVDQRRCCYLGAVVSTFSAEHKKIQSHVLKRMLH